MSHIHAPTIQQVKDLEEEEEVTPHIDTCHNARVDFYGGLQ